MISVVLPAHNEASSIRGAVIELDCELSRLFSEAEIIVVDDGSTDKTLDQLAGLNSNAELVLIRRNTCEGKGSAIRSGLSLARGSVIAYTDADMPISPYSVISAIFQVSSGSCDVCVGNRRDTSSLRLGATPRARELASLAYKTYVQIFFARLPNDPACCLKAFSSEIGKRVASEASLTNFDFDIEALLIAQHAGAIFKEIAVSWIDKRSRLSPLRLLGRGFQALIDMIILRWKYGVLKVRDFSH